jgi:murein DD-endopeptidase MepM/ murein hydrolase activator NlpD
MGYPMRINVIRTEHLLNPATGGKFGASARGSRAHWGWDIRARIGTPVYAVGPGEVTAALEKVSGYGSLVQLKFVRGHTHYWALYAHLGVLFCHKGQLIQEGMALGLTGHSGNARGEPPHLHFEVATSPSLRKGRRNMIDPALILGDFLRDNPAGQAVVVERSLSPLPLTIEDVELAERAGRTS